MAGKMTANPDMVKEGEMKAVCFLFVLFFNLQNADNLKSRLAMPLKCPGIERYGRQCLFQSIQKM